MKQNWIAQQRAKTNWRAVFTAGAILLTGSLCGAETPPASTMPGKPVDASKIVFNPERWQQRGLSTQLFPWPGERLVFLTTRSNLDQAVMANFVRRLDAGWQVYTNITGRSPSLFKQLDGKPTITAVPDGSLTCGVGCGYIGATGIELAKFYQEDYPLILAQTNAYPHYCFYEMGRNFYTFGDRHSLFITGYAVFMRYVCMDALGCADPDGATRKVIEETEALYAKSGMDFLRAFTTLGGLSEKQPRVKRADGNWLQPSDQPVLYASAMLKLRRDCGGDAWVKRFFAELVKCPKIKADNADTALRQSLNWLVAASCAARRDLSPMFVDRWRFPIPAESRQILGAIPWEDPAIDASVVLKRLAALTEAK